MSRRVDIPLADLLLDQKNARLGDEQANQQAAAHVLAEQQGRRLVKLAEDIVERGMDPSQLAVVVATGDKRRRYIVLEGNRRVLALKALETPTLVQAALAANDFKKLAAVAARYEQSPIEQVHCVLYDANEEQEAYEFVLNRHGGARDGAGLVEWDSDEKDRFRARHGGDGVRTYAGQVLDLLTTVDGPSQSKTKITTNMQRLLKSAPIREKLGLDHMNGELVSHFPLDEVLKGLRKITDDLRTQRVRVPDIYHDENRQTYMKTLTKADLPDPSQRLPQPVRLADLPSGKAQPVPTKPKKPRVKPKQPRTTVAASDAKINPGPPRINAVYNELVQLSADSFPNAGSVLLRVFVELSVNDYLDTKGVMSEDDRRNQPLAKRWKAVNDHLLQHNQISKALHTTISQVANSRHGIAAGVTTMNQYVHNSFSFPKASELRATWDEVQPFLEVVWK